MNILTHRRCSTCGETKPLSEFYKDERYKGGRRPQCKACNLDKQRLWRDTYPEKVKKNRKRWRANNPGAELERTRQWMHDNPEKVSEYNRLRHEREAAAGGTFTVKDRETLKKRYRYTCLCCGRREPEIRLEMDHVVPVVLGGSNAIENRQPLCSHCNSSKGAKIIDYRNRWMR